MIEYGVKLNVIQVIINNCPIAVGVENPQTFWMCRQLRNVRKLVDRYPLLLQPVAPPISDTTLTHVMRLYFLFIYKC
jgi:hypothetical protein